ncbi:type IV toxin-antitoxin system AbiEi family antitoxin domain-containing protein [Rhodococcus sp. NPDC058521]|uniref:type IV toxin-antitoxin system AbiEi family antitoxin domain-containing protein n=1 Tax=Rhodococcus sp. NPDC058521 TaxID=3346536 RepID=UPI00365C3549
MTNALKELAVSQFGLVTHSQLHALGYPRSRVRHRVESGRWQAVLHGVYAVSTGPISRAATLEAALLFGGNGALLSHYTAAEEWGMIRAEDARPVHITVPYGRSAICQGQTVVGSELAASSLCHQEGAAVHPGVAVHRSRAQNFIGVEMDQPRTTRADTAVDLAVEQDTAEEAYASLVRTVGNSRIPLVDIRRRLDERRPRRYRKVLADAVRLLAEGVQSLLEYRYAVDVESAHGIPPALRQSPVVVDGRTLFEDCDYSPYGVPLIVRLDGRGTHSMAEVAFRDRRRDNAAELARRPRLVYGYDEVTKNACEVAREVETVLTREGWVRTHPSPCRACEWSARAETR